MGWKEILTAGIGLLLTAGSGIAGDGADNRGTPVQVDATASNPMRLGVWSGTLGSIAINACFNGSESNYSGSYYYKKFLMPIALIKGETGDQWIEENSTGHWKLEIPENGVMTGSWSDPKAKKNLPIHLRLIDRGSGSSPCSGYSFNTPLEQPPALKLGKMIRLANGRGYRQLSFAGRETIELIGEENGIPKINKAIQIEVDKTVLAQFYQRRRESLGKTGFANLGDEDRIEFQSWLGNIVTIGHFTWPAGFGASAANIEYRYWNVDTGEEVDLWAWFGLKNHQLSPRLEKRLFTTQATMENCRGDLQYKRFKLTLENKGFKFSHFGPSNECPDLLYIPFDKATHFLTSQGQRGLKDIVGR